MRHKSPQLPPPSSLAISTLPGSRRSSGLTLGPSVKRPYFSYSNLIAFLFDLAELFFELSVFIALVYKVFKSNLVSFSFYPSVIKSF